ncbi:FAD binding domain-containing protein [Saccharopolyspora sp. NPDC000995]
MKPPPFAYERATDIEAALELLREHGDEAKSVAGGQSLIPLLNLRMARPAMLVDINDLLLAGVDIDGDTVTTGALVRHRTLCDDGPLRRANPLLSEAARFIGHAAIRNRGTVGGSIAHADPSAELALVALACDAQVLLRSAETSRAVPAAEFFQGPFMSAKEPEELVVGVRWPAISGSGWGFAEIAERSGDFASAAAAVVLDGTDGRPRVAVSGVPGSPARLAELEEALVDPGLDASALREVAQAAATRRLPDDAYRRRLVTEMVARAGGQALERSRGTT